MKVPSNLPFPVSAEQKSIFSQKSVYQLFTFFTGFKAIVRIVERVLVELKQKNHQIPKFETFWGSRDRR